MLGTDERYASFEVRLVAAILDVIVLLSFFLLFFAAAVFELLVTSDFGDVDPPDTALFVALGIIIGYFVLFIPLYFILLWTWHGQTAGQMAMHIKVVRRNGDSVGVLSAILRLLGYIFLLATLFLGFLMALWDGEKRGLHDRLADTVVIETP